MYLHSTSCAVSACAPSSLLLLLYALLSLLPPFILPFSEGEGDDGAGPARPELAANSAPCPAIREVRPRPEPRLQSDSLATDIPTRQSSLTTDHHLQSAIMPLCRSLVRPPVARLSTVRHPAAPVTQARTTSPIRRPYATQREDFSEFKRICAFPSCPPVGKPAVD